MDVDIYFKRFIDQRYKICRSSFYSKLCMICMILTTRLKIYASDYFHFKCQEQVQQWAKTSNNFNSLVMVVVLRNSLLLCVIAIIAVAIFHYFNVSFFYLETRPLDRVLFKASCFPTCFREKKDKADDRQFKILIVKQIRAPYSSCIWTIQSNNNRSCYQLQIFLTNVSFLHPQPPNSNEESIIFFIFSKLYL